MLSMSATPAFTTFDIDDDPDTQSQQPGLDTTAFLESNILPPTCLGQGHLDCLVHRTYLFLIVAKENVSLRFQ